MYARRLFISAIGALIPLAAANAGVTLDPEQIARIDKVFTDYDKPGSPGCALGVMSEAQLIYSRGYGQATLEPPAHNDAAKLFDIASMSKQFTAASIVLLAQQGRINLTDDVRKYIPELPSYGKTITINNLLWHTSGLRDYTLLLLLGNFDYPEVTTRQQALDFVVRQKNLDFTPGTRYSYSNTGYFLMSVIIERVAGLSENDFARRYFFNPLGMPNSVFRDRHDLPIPNQALGYSGPNEQGGFDIYMSNWEQVGDGGLQTSVEELLRWDENFYTAQVGGPAFIREMLNTGKLDTGRKLTYARGLQVDHYRGLNRVRHGGDWVGYHSNMERFPTEHTTIALLCNLEEAPQYDLSNKVIDIVLEKQFTEPKPVDPPPQPSLPAERFYGTYYSKDTKQTYSVTDVDGALSFNLLDFQLPMVALGPTRFGIAGFPTVRIDFAVKDDEPANAVQFQLDRDDPDTLPDNAGRVTPPATGDISPYLGKFHCAELNITWDLITDENGNLAVLVEGGAPVLGVNGPLSPLFKDAFFGNAGTLQFTRNTVTAKVDGFRMSYNSQIDYRFERAR